MAPVANIRAGRPPVLDRSGGFVVCRPAAVVAILNCTPDSFSDGGNWADPHRAIAHAMAMAAAGADWLDIGGESTRPGSTSVDADEQIRRVVPVIAAIHAALPDLALSIDTTSPEVAEAALEAGARIVNDVSAGRDPGMLSMLARRGTPVVLMHMHGIPADMQRDPRYGDVVAEVCDHLRARIAAAQAAGIDRRRIAVDPGIGFGKRVEDNLALLSGLERIEAATGCPLMVGISRKSFLGAASGVDLPPSERDGLSHAMHAALAMRCAWLRVHDVAGAVAAVRLAAAVHAVAALAVTGAGLQHIQVGGG